MNEQILRELGLENITSNEELVEQLLNDETAFEKLSYALEVYSDEIDSIREDIKQVEKEYDEKLYEINTEIDHLRNEANNYVREYNDFTRELAGYDSNKKLDDSVTNRLEIIEQELAKINRKETLLNGRISKKTSELKEQLIREKEELIQDKESYKKWRTEAKENYDNKQNEKKEKEEEKEKIIKEKADKKIELTEQLSVLSNLKKEYQKIQASVFEKYLEQKEAIDKEHDEFLKTYENETDDLVKASMGAERIELYYKKKASDEKFIEALSNYGMSAKEFDRIKNLENDTVEELIKYYRVVDPVKADDLFLQSKMWEKAGLKANTVKENFKTWKEKNSIGVKEEPSIVIENEVSSEEKGLAEEAISTKLETHNIDPIQLDEMIQEKEEETKSEEPVEETKSDEQVEEAKSEVTPVDMVEVTNSTVKNDDEEIEEKTEEIVNTEEQTNEKSNIKSIEDYWDMMYPGYKEQHEKEVENKSDASKIAEQEVTDKLNSIPNVGEEGSLYTNTEIAPGVYGINPNAFKVNKYDENGMAIVEDNIVEPTKEEPKKEEKTADEVMEQTNFEIGQNVSDILNESKESEVEVFDLSTDQNATMPSNTNEEAYDTTLDIPVKDDTKTNTENNDIENNKTIITKALNFIKDNIDERLKNTSNSKLYSNVANYMDLDLSDKTNQDIISRSVGKTKDYFDKKGIKIKDYLELSETEQNELLDKAGIPKKEISKTR